MFLRSSLPSGVYSLSRSRRLTTVFMSSSLFFIFVSAALFFPPLLSLSAPILHQSFFSSSPITASSPCSRADLRYSLPTPRGLSSSLHLLPLKFSLLSLRILRPPSYLCRRSRPLSTRQPIYP